MKSSEAKPLDEYVPFQSTSKKVTGSEECSPNGHCLL